MNAFAEIEVTPLFSRDGMQSRGKSVRITGEKGWDEVGVVSSNYLLVHNSKVKDVVDQIAIRSRIGDWKPRKTWFDGRRFVYALTSDSITAEVAPGDIVRFGLIGYNSYDGSRALTIGTYAEHLVCANGMTSDLFFARFTFRHQQGNVNWHEETERAFLAVMPGSRARLTRFASTLLKLKQRELTMPDLQSIREKHLAEINVSGWGRIMDQYLSHEAHTAFGLLDACTSTFWHNPKQANADFRNNSYATDGMLSFADTPR
jgi:hypothetical protein